MRVAIVIAGITIMVLMTMWVTDHDAPINVGYGETVPQPMVTETK